LRGLRVTRSRGGGLMSLALPPLTPVLDGFDALHREGLDVPPLRTLAERTHLPYGSVHRICQRAVADGWLVRVVREIDRDGRGAAPYCGYMLAELAGSWQTADVSDGR
jgi:hypothetical protein